MREAGQPVIDKWLKKGVRNHPIRIMIVGIPNVGKSTLINRILGKNKAAAQNRPGVTRNTQWVEIGKNLELLDTPGVLWPKFEKVETGFHLAVTGAIKEDVFDREMAAPFCSCALKSGILRNWVPLMALPWKRWIRPNPSLIKSAGHGVP